jgi:hypothetical protein
MSLTTPFSVQKLQTALHAKAKESADFRFYALYDKVYRKDVWAFAYERWLIGSAFQLLRQFVQPSLFAICLDVLEGLAVDPGCSAIGFARNHDL